MIRIKDKKKTKTKTKKINVITFLTFNFPIAAMPKTLLFKQGRKSVKHSVNNIFKFSSFLNLVFVIFNCFQTLNNKGN